MKYFLTVFLMFFIDEKLLKCSQPTIPFHEIVTAYLHQIPKIEQTAQKTIQKFNQTNPQINLQQKPHDRPAHFVFESIDQKNPYQLKLKPYVHFESFVIKLTKPNQKTVEQVVQIDDLTMLHATMLAMLSTISCA